MNNYNKINIFNNIEKIFPKSNNYSYKKIISTKIINGDKKSIIKEVININGKKYKKIKKIS